MRVRKKTYLPIGKEPGEPLLPLLRCVKSRLFFEIKSNPFSSRNINSMSHYKQPLIFSALLLSLSLLFNSGCKVQEYTSNSNPIDHQKWDDLLQNHVSPEGWVNYPGFIQDSLRLNEYLDLLKKNHPNEKNWNRNEQMAYWINAYNAFTIKLVIVIIRCKVLKI